MWRRGPKVNTNIQLYFRSQSSGISSFHAGWSDGRCLHQVPVLGRAALRSLRTKSQLESNTIASLYLERWDYLPIKLQGHLKGSMVSQGSD